MTPISHIFPNSEIQKFTKATGKRILQEERPGLGADGLFISEEAKRLQQRQSAIEAAKKEIENTPLIRENLVAQIREKLANGEYIQLSEDVAGVIADRIVKNLYLG